MSSPFRSALRDGATENRAYNFLSAIHTMFVTSVTNWMSEKRAHQRLFPLTLLCNCISLLNSHGIFFYYSTKIESCRAGFSACGGSQSDKFLFAAVRSTRSAFLCHRKCNAISYDTKKEPYKSTTPLFVNMTSKFDCQTDNIIRN